MSGPKICPQCAAAYELDQRFCPKDGTTLRLQNATGDLVGTVIADRYHVQQKLGEGGMGQVYLAEHVKMGRKSALKVMNPALVKDADAISRFNREAANASRINHPNVADVYDFGETPDGIIYLAMEFVDGPPLTKLIESEGPLPPARAAQIIRQTADALAAAHDMGIVHRDLKPDNLMVARGRDGADLVKVVDFGIAKAAGNDAQKVTKTGLVIGTPEYMSPEQLSGDAVDGRTDIYALALVAFNMLTGKLPFPGATAQESMIMRLTDAPRKLSEMRPEVAWPTEVQSTLDKALARDANARYRSSSEFGRALAEALERMPAQPRKTVGASAGAAAEQPTLPITRVAPDRRPAQPVGAAARPARPHRVAYAVGGAVLVAALIGAVVVMQRPGAAVAKQDSVTPLGRPPSDVSKPDTSGLGHRGETVKLAGAGSGGTTQRSVAAPPRADVTAVLDSLEQVVSGDVTPNEAARVISTLEQMRDRISGNQQRVQAAVVDALAESSRNNKAAACTALRNVAPIAPTTTLAKRVSFTMRQSC